VKNKKKGKKKIKTAYKRKCDTKKNKNSEHKKEEIINNKKKKKKVFLDVRRRAKIAEKKY